MASTGSGCSACGLSKSRRSVVYGRGEREDADVLIVGEAPGLSDDMIGEAFIGDAGRLLDEMIRQAGLDGFRIFRTNIVLCRPAERIGGAGREPKPEEIAACGENVGAILDLANPRAVVLAGDLAAKYYGKRFPRARKIQHPAYLLKTGGTRSPYWLKNIRTLEEVRAEIEG